MKLMNLIIFEIKTMKTKLTLAVFLFCLNIYGQENVVNDSVQKENPIVFCELYFGIGGGNNSNDSNKSLTIFGANVNYQFNKRDLITARFSGLWLSILERYVSRILNSASVSSDRHRAKSGKLFCTVSLSSLPKLVIGSIFFLATSIPPNQSIVRLYTFHRL